MAKATTSLDDDKFERMLKDWNECKETHLIYDLPPDAPKWRGEALKYFMSCKNPNPAYSIAERVKDIARASFKTHKKSSGYFSSEDEDEDEDEDEVEWMKGLLDELEAYDVESIDVATLLHSRRMLSSFLVDVFSNKHACVRAKAAELVTSMVQNHPTTQQLVIDGNGIQLLLHNFTTDPDASSLGALSSLIWNNKSGITVFLQEDGYKALRNALNLGTVLAGSSIHNEVENLIGYLRRESSNLYLKFGDDSEVVQEARKGGNKKKKFGDDDSEVVQEARKGGNKKKGRSSSSSSSSKRMKLH